MLINVIYFSNYLILIIFISYIFYSFLRNCYLLCLIKLTLISVLTLVFYHN